MRGFGGFDPRASKGATGSSQSLGVDGGAGPATATCSHQCAATASEIDPVQWGIHADSRCSWDDGHEKVEVNTIAQLPARGFGRQCGHLDRRCAFLAEELVAGLAQAAEVLARDS
jgi:hypothetical protein